MKSSTTLKLRQSPKSKWRISVFSVLLYLFVVLIALIIVAVVYSWQFSNKANYFPDVKTDTSNRNAAYTTKTTTAIIPKATTSKRTEMDGSDPLVHRNSGPTDETAKNRNISSDGRTIPGGDKRSTSEKNDAMKENTNWKQHPDAKDTIAFAVTLTDCSKGDGLIPFHIAEGAAVLQHTIHWNSIHNFNVTGGKYDYRLYALYHPEAAECAPILAEFGFILLESKFPVEIEEIKGSVLRSRIHKNGCCGERELIKLVAFSLIQHEIVVLLDLDVLILKPLDHLFDLILTNKVPESGDHLMKTPTTDPTLPKRIDLLYTLDYAMVSHDRKVKPVQGGFVVIRSNMTVYHDYIDIVREGDFREIGGWGGKTGKFWGAMTFQGLVPYYFHVLNPGRSVEINWCLYDNMCSPSREGAKENNYNGQCFTQQENCEDCRDRPASDIYLFHFTVCQKPWTCQRHVNGDFRENALCRAMHHEWFHARSSLEQSWGRSGWGTGKNDRNHFYGYCSGHGHMGYMPIQKPYGTIV